jgi:hypothetical protein
MVAVFGVRSFAATIYVPADQPTIQDGIDVTVDGDTVLVSPGRYFESINFAGRQIVVRAPRGSMLTIIDAAGTGGRAATFDSGEGPESQLIGFTIENGNASFAELYGGGVYCENASPRIEDCVFARNMAFIYGKAAYINGGAPTFVRTAFEDNVNGGEGTVYISGPATVTFDRCEFVGNRGPSIFLRGSVALNMDHCLFAENYFDVGAGILTSGGGSPMIDLENCTFVRNHASFDFCAGSAIQVGEGSVSVRNSIIAFNTGCSAIRFESLGSFSGDYNCYFGNSGNDCFTCDLGTNAFSSDPQFSDTSAGDYTLSPLSPCLDAGDPNPANNDPDGTRNDVGAFWRCITTDCDGDGVEDSLDNCKTVYDPSQADSDGDGIGDMCDSCPLDPVNDPDKDGICATTDNCPVTFNPSQADTNQNGVGDPCDCLCVCHGDPDCSGVASDVLDVMMAIETAFGGTTAAVDLSPRCNTETTDVNCSGATDLVDVVRIINVAFRGANAATEYCEACP